MLYYVTGNKHKFAAAKQFFDQAEMAFEQRPLDLPELQLESLEEIAILKADAAFERIQQPLIINDSGWFIEALNGFPGPYMKFVNKWFRPEDFLRLMQGVENRKVTLRQVVIYKDATQTKVFTHDSVGRFIDQVRGESGPSGDRVISLSEDGLTISEQLERQSFGSSEAVLWQEIINWIKENSH